MLEVPDGDITLLSLSRYSDIYANVSGSFQNYLKNAFDVLTEKVEDDLGLNVYSFIDLKNEPNTKEIMHTFDRFFLAFGRFPAINELTVVPTGDVPSFVQSNEIILSTDLHKNVIWTMLQD